MQLFPVGAEFDLPSKSRVKVESHLPGFEVECRYVWMSFPALEGKGRYWVVAFDPHWLWTYGRRVQ